MRKLVLLASLALTTQTIATPKFSNVMVFGDSLSDIGNMPESPYIISPVTKQIAQNVYVPISNPINTTNISTYRPPLSLERIPFPKNTKDYAKYLPLLSTAIGGPAKKRQFHSYNWPLFFINEAYHHKMITTPTITPWYLTQKEIQNFNPRRMSVDFAFAGATSEDNCYDFEYANKNPHCTQTDIYSGQQAYRDNIQTVRSVEIPGFQKQIQLFLNDRQAKRLVVDDKTLYAIMIGNNDLNKTLLALMNMKQNPGAAINELAGVYAYGVAGNVNKGLHTLIAHGAKHIVVMGLYNPGETPYLVTNIWDNNPNVKPWMKKALVTFAAVSTMDYNAQIVLTVKALQKKYPGVSIHYFDLFNRIDTLHNSYVYSHKDTRYQMCIKRLDPQNINDFVASHKLNCSTVPGIDNYTFWNGTHLTAKTNEFIADQLDRFMRDKDDTNNR